MNQTRQEAAIQLFLIVYLVTTIVALMCGAHWAMVMTWIVVGLIACVIVGCVIAGIVETLQRLIRGW